MVPLYHQSRPVLPMAFRPRGVALSICLLLLYKTPYAVSQSVTPAEQIEQQLGLSRATHGGPTRGGTRGAGRVASAPATPTGPIITRTAITLRKNAEDVRYRGRIEITAKSAEQATVKVPVYENAAAVFNNILFKKDSVEFADASSDSQIQEIAQVLANHREVNFVVEGHTCDLGSTTHNQALALVRASAIVSRLMAAGVTKDQVIPLGFGESDPAVSVDPSSPSSDEFAEAKRSLNRRVVIRVQPKSPTGS